MSAPGQSTLALLRDRLSDTRPPVDPRVAVAPPGSQSWPAAVRAELVRPLRPAGVLIPVIERDAGLVVLLTQRAAALKHHASQVAFPGGGMEPGDRTIADTALRETREEVGIEPAEVTILGYLNTLPTITGYAVTPVVASVAATAVIAVDPVEVELAFEVPLEFLLDRRNARAGVRRFRGHELPIIEYRYGPHRIWGATANMLVNFMEKIK